MAGSPHVLDVDLRIAAGEFVALVGPSRSGKSLVIELAAGLVRPEAGRVVLLGHEWNDTQESEQTPVRLRVGTVLQQPGLLSNMTLFHNVLLPLRYHHGAMPERSREQAVMAQLERLGGRAPARSHLDPHGHSGGTAGRGGRAAALRLASSSCTTGTSPRWKTSSPRSRR